MTETSNQVPDDKVTIEIDGQTVLADKGSMIIHATDAHGINVPRFCYHKKLSIAANCRMCMVDVEKAPKPLPACATPVAEGMKIYTRSKRATSGQKNAMEFLLINHPLDCPICDQGGECELQDVAMGYGRDVSRFVEGKRSVADENLGSLVASDMTRCIHCTRCVRFLNEIAGTDELGGIGRGDRTYIATAIGQGLDSELSGNIIDLCPVGALTNKPFRFKARAWELMATAGLSMHDALGSNIYYHTRHGKILRAVPRENEAINEAWLSDRDRYGIHGLNHDQDRVTQPMVKQNGQWNVISWEDALGILVNKLKDTAPEKVALYTGQYATSEEYYLLKKIFDQLGSDQHEHRLNTVDFSMPYHSPRHDVALADVAAQENIILVGSYARHEQPILNHKIRQAWLKGAQINAFGPCHFEQNYDLNLDITGNQLDWVKKLGALGVSLSEISGQRPDGALGDWLKQQSADEDINSLAKSLLKNNQKVLFVVGHIAARHPQAQLIQALVAWMAGVVKASVNELLLGANTYGAGVNGLYNDRDIKQNDHAVNLIYQAEIQDFAEPARIKECLVNSEMTVVFNAFCDEALKSRADLILPIALLPESSGSLINNDGTRQTALVAHKAPGETKPGWRVLRVLGNMLNLSGFDYEDVHEVMQQTEQLKLPVVKSPMNLKEISNPKAKGLVLFAHQGIYDGDALVRRSRPLQESKIATADNVYVNPGDLLSIGFAAGDLVSVEQNGRYAELTLATDEAVPAGSAVVPMGRSATLNINAGELSVSIIGAQS
ncbi:NADH-quinone oxidoreductase [Marinicella pacifica]|uniref:NADH-quinone oxidoreductase n=1 Tax=Marinicella pacifica TaxID=1171543 RepID=A0A917FLN7_9GAMM|nr:NADH-quinone oxidoreductase subunit NuoG [Marinicella pacifica]GGF91276.1 NADH-quinone oxidoreductase [Marinicella pacifica]